MFCEHCLPSEKDRIFFGPWSRKKAEVKFVVNTAWMFHKQMLDRLEHIMMYVLPPISFLNFSELRKKDFPSDPPHFVNAEGSTLPAFHCESVVDVANALLFICQKSGVWLCLLVTFFGASRLPESVRFALPLTVSGTIAIAVPNIRHTLKDVLRLPLEITSIVCQFLACTPQVLFRAWWGRVL